MGKRCVFPTWSVCFCQSSLLQVRRKYCSFINKHNKDKTEQVSSVHHSQFQRHMTLSHVTALSPLKTIRDLAAIIVTTTSEKKYGE